MPKIPPEDIEPFEICSIRPPTENGSLTFRLTRNCYWNRCRFCPVYKRGAKFSRRSADEVIADIRRAKLLDDFLFQEGIGIPLYSTGDYRRASTLIERIRKCRWEAGLCDDTGADDDSGATETFDDERIAWFRTWFKDRPTLEDSINHLITWRIDGGKTCFLGDADSLILKPDFVSRIISEIKVNFPTIGRFTIYGKTRSAARVRTQRELNAFRTAGIDRVHFGLESGSDAVLALVNKGVTRADHIEGCAKVRDAGISCSVYVMPGLGGVKFSEEHAAQTGTVISQISPDFVRIRSLEVFPGTPLAGDIESGAFDPVSEEQAVREIRTMIENIDAKTSLISDSAANLLHINGSLPEERGRMLSIIDSYLNLSKRNKLIYSLQSRLDSFIGQYGGLSSDIFAAVAPIIRNDEIDISRASDDDLERIIRLVRSKLMP